MKVHVETHLDCAPHKVWAEVQRSALLLEVARPVVAVRPLDGEQFPDRWQQGSTLQCRSYLFGLIPLGTRTLYFETIDDDAREIQTRERDRIVRTWDHLDSVQSAGDDSTLYSDDIEIEAGLLTPLVGLFAHCFYRHRQRRWRRFARRL